MARRCAIASVRRVEVELVAGSAFAFPFAFPVDGVAARVGDSFSKFEYTGTTVVSFDACRGALVWCGSAGREGIASSMSPVL